MTRQTSVIEPRIGTQPQRAAKPFEAMSRHYAKNNNEAMNSEFHDGVVVTVLRKTKNTKMQLNGSVILVRTLSLRTCRKRPPYWVRM